MRERGDTILLDNGAYEGFDGWKRLEELISVYRPHFVSLPDYLLQPAEKTYNAALDFLEENYEKYPDVRWMFIPQAEKGQIVEWLDSLITALDNPGITAIGIPRALATDISLDPLIRVNACQWIKKHRPDVYVHAMGMVRGNIDELPLLAQAGCDSIDSAAPVWRGWYGVQLIETSGKTVVPDCNFEAPFDIAPWKENVILRNLEACGVDTRTTTR